MFAGRPNTDSSPPVIDRDLRHPSAPASGSVHGMSGNRKPGYNNSKFAIGIGVGVAIGVAIGILTHNTGAGIAIGVALGVALGAGMSRNR